MPLTLRPDQETEISALAAQRGCTPDELGQRIVDERLAHERWLAEGVAEGREDAELGRLTDHADIVRQLEQRYSG